jgi:hypothetical protein
MFFRGSRYQDVPTLDHQGVDGRVIRYKALRCIPPTPGIARHIVDEGERSDHIAFEHFRDPERFWRLADANLVIHPETLVDEPGRVIDVPASEG